MSKEIDFEQYVISGKGTPLLDSILLSMEGEPIEYGEYPIDDNYHNIAEFLGSHEDLIDFTYPAPSPSFTDMHPYYDIDKKKILVPKYNSYSINTDSRGVEKPYVYALRLGDNYLGMLVEARHGFDELTNFEHEYLFILEDEQWQSTRDPDHIKKAADIASTAISLSDDKPPVVKLVPF